MPGCSLAKHANIFILFTITNFFWRWIPAQPEIETDRSDDVSDKADIEGKRRRRERREEWHLFPRSWREIGRWGERRAKAHFSVQMIGCVTVLAEHSINLLIFCLFYFQVSHIFLPSCKEWLEESCKLFVTFSTSVKGSGYIIVTWFKSYMIPRNLLHNSLASNRRLP